MTNKCESSWWPDSDAAVVRSKRNTLSVLGTGSVSVKCFMTFTAGDGNVKHISSCAPEDFSNKDPWSITYLFIAVLKIHKCFHEVEIKQQLLREKKSANSNVTFLFLFTN